MTEKLQYISLHREDALYSLVIQCDGGGVAESFTRSMDAARIAHGLRAMAARLELTVEERAAHYAREAAKTEKGEMTDGQRRCARRAWGKTATDPRRR